MLQNLLRTIIKIFRKEVAFVCSNFIFPTDFSLGSLLRVYIRGCNVFVYRKSKIFWKKNYIRDYSQKVAKSGKKSQNPAKSRKILHFRQKKTFSPGLGIPPSSEEANKHVFGQLGVRSIRWRKKNFKTMFKITNIEPKTFSNKLKNKFINIYKTKLYL